MLEVILQNIMLEPGIREEKLTTSVCGSLHNVAVKELGEVSEKIGDV